MAQALAVTTTSTVDDPKAQTEASSPAESSALHELYRAHASAVVTRLRRLCGDDELARDLAHDAFVIATRRIEHAPDDPPPAAWLHAIAYNVLRDHRRSRQRRSRLWAKLFARALPPPLSGEGPRPPASLATRLEAVLASLDDGQRDAFVLRVIEGVPLRDAAQILDTTVQTVSYRAKRAEAIVREHMEEEST